MGPAVCGDLAFLHGLEQRALGFRGRAVDLVGQDQLGKDGAAVKFELIAVPTVNGHADDVGGQQVAGELDALIA